MEVYALVGGSGTGKSHRASLLANEYGIDLIIDDGLVIRDSKILGGRSAKREQTRVAAVRRATFQDSVHAADVMALISEIDPKRLLILGTSRAMIDRIVNALDLPRPLRYVAIDDVASPDEIRRAMRVRREHGKHVIPAPTFEVKRTFSGYLVDPLRLKVFLRGRRSRIAAVDVEKSVVRPTFSSLGKYSIADTVVNTIMRTAADQVDGVAKVGRVGVDGSDEGVLLRLEVILEYGRFLPDIAEQVQREVRRTVEHMTAMNVLSVVVTVARVAVE